MLGDAMVLGLLAAIVAVVAWWSCYVVYFIWRVKGEEG